MIDFVAEDDITRFYSRFKARGSLREREKKERREVSLFGLQVDSTFLKKHSIHFFSPHLLLQLFFPSPSCHIEKEWRAKVDWIHYKHKTFSLIVFQLIFSFQGEVRVRKKKWNGLEDAERENTREEVGVWPPSVHSPFLIIIFPCPVFLFPYPSFPGRERERFFVDHYVSRSTMMLLKTRGGKNRKEDESWPHDVKFTERDTRNYFVMWK